MQFLYTENVNGKKTTGVLGEGSIRHRLNPHDAVDSHVRRWAELVNEVVGERSENLVPGRAVDEVMFAVVGDLAHADVLNILVFTFLNDHQELTVGANEPLRNVSFLVVFHQLLEAGATQRRTFTFPRPALSHLNTRLAVHALVDGRLEPTIRMRDLVDFDVEANQIVPVTHPQLINAVEVVLGKANHPKDRASWNVVVVKLFPHDPRAQFQCPGWILMEEATERVFLIHECMFDMKTVNALFHTFQSSNVFFVIFNDQLTPFAKDNLLVWVNINFPRWRHGIFPQIRRFIILTSPQKFFLLWNAPMWHRGKVHEWTSGAFHQVFRLIHMPNIIVLVKQVPDTNAKIVVSGDRVDLSSVKMVMSPYDEFAVETALQHREASGGEVTALTVGGPGAEKILKDAKAIGVDNIVRIDADGEMDSNALQTLISQAVNDLGGEVVYCGKSAADTGAGSTGPGVAERMGWASVSNIVGATFDGGLSVTTPSGGGNAKVSVPLPAVVSCDKGGFKVRKPNVKGIMQAKKASVDVRSIEAPTSSVSVVSHALPPAKPAGKSYEGGAAAAEVAKLLRDEANVL